MLLGRSHIIFEIQVGQTSNLNISCNSHMYTSIKLCPIFQDLSNNILHAPESLKIKSQHEKEKKSTVV
jgi:hypothetical protein